MTDEQRDPKVSYRMPPERLEAINDLAERFNVSRSALLRRFDAFGIESNIEALGVEARIAEKRREIIDYHKPIDDAGGFAGRVRQDFEKRFKNGYEAKFLRAKAESYYDEARMLEEKVPEHPDAPPIEEGELVEKVDRVLDDTLQALTWTDWEDRWENEFQKFDGVESGLEGMQFTLALTRSALRIEHELESFRGSKFDRHVQSDDLPPLAKETLPPHISLDDVAEAAQQLAAQGMTEADVPDDPTEIDLFGEGDPEAIDVDGEHVEESPAIDPGETDGGMVEVDGGDNTAIQAFDVPDASAVIEQVARTLRTYPDSGTDLVRSTLRDTPKYSNFMDQSNLTEDDLIDLADDYNEKREAAQAGRREALPETVEDGDGGVRVE